jgi:hypothetical protein
LRNATGGGAGCGLERKNMKDKEIKKFYIKRLAEMASFFYQSEGYPTDLFLEDLKNTTAEDKIKMIMWWLKKKKIKFNGTKRNEK